jgi:hypothetical protein
MKKHRRLYYVPGMISLILLPVMCYYYLIPFKKDERALEIILAQKYEPQYKNTIRFDTRFLYEPLYKRNYIDIKLNGNEKDDKIKLEFFRLKLREMMKENDTIAGLHLLFVDSVKYKIFVESVNICMKEGILRYACFENNLWTFNMSNDKATMERYKKRREENHEKYLEEIANRKVAEFTQLDWLNISKKIWPIYLVLLVISLASIYKMRKLRYKAN